MYSIHKKTFGFWEAKYEKSEILEECIQRGEWTPQVTPVSLKMSRHVKSQNVWNKKFNEGAQRSGYYWCGSCWGVVGDSGAMVNCSALPCPDWSMNATSLAAKAAASWLLIEKQVRQMQTKSRTMVLLSISFIMFPLLANDISTSLETSHPMHSHIRSIN